MKIDRTLKIKEKYFNAIMKREKPFELRHFYLAPNSIVKLDCIDSNNIDTGRYLIFKSGKCVQITINEEDIWADFNDLSATFKRLHIWTSTWNDKSEKEYHGAIGIYSKYGYEYLWQCYDWLDKFVFEYCKKAPTYLIEIAEFLEVK